MKNQEKVKALLNGVDIGNMEQGTQMLSAWVAANLRPCEYFQLTNIRYDDRNAVTERVSTIVL